MLQRYVNVAHKLSLLSKYHCHHLLLLGVATIVILIILLLFCIICVFPCHCILSKSRCGIFSVCNDFCACCLLHEVRQALMNLHRCWLGSIEKWSFIMSHPLVEPWSLISISISITILLSSWAVPAAGNSLQMVFITRSVSITHR